MSLKSIVFSVILTGVVTIASTLFLTWFQDKNPELTYTTALSIPFDGETQKLSIFQIDIANSGKKTAENVKLSVQIPNGSIEQFKVNIDSAIDHQSNKDNGEFTLTVSELNPKETAKVSLLLNTKLSTPPEVSLRARGISGISASDVKKIEWKDSLWIPVLAAYMGIGVSVLFSGRGRKIMRVLISRGLIVSNERQKHVLASLFAIHGDLENWLEADILTAEVLSSDQATKHKIINILNALTDVNNIASHSLAIIYYNIGRLYYSLNEHIKGKENLDEAIKISKIDITKRLSTDPFMKGMGITAT
jgi:hypothetical protein